MDCFKILNICAGRRVLYLGARGHNSGRKNSGRKNSGRLAVKILGVRILDVNIVGVRILAVNSGRNIQFLGDSRISGT